MTDRPKAETSALSDILTMTKKDLLLKLNPEKIEAASDEALAVSLELAEFARQLRQLRAEHGPDVLKQLADDEPSTASAAQRPRAHRTRQVLAPVLTLMPASTDCDALTLCNSCDSRQMDPSDPRGYCLECAAETDGAEQTRRQLADANARINEAHNDQAPEDEQGRRRDSHSEWSH